MTDKDLIARSVINEIFPHARTLLCKFHTKKTFQLNVTVKNMGISCAEVDFYLDLMFRMCDSPSEARYNKLFEKFYTNAHEHPKLLNYFVNNWHDNRNEWTTFGMNQTINFDNLTNNRSESNNCQLKRWLTPNDTLTNALKNLFKWLENRKENQLKKTAKTLYKTNTKQISSDPEILKYHPHLSTCAFEKVQIDLENYHLKKLVIINHLFKECKIKKVMKEGNNSDDIIQLDVKNAPAVQEMDDDEKESEKNFMKDVTF
ncbi:protein FAR1-RELATED SEQUENCE 5-like [Aphidius gifuensis]|uniref:protein FAR1-RELATED SEQUENCE 5-like n=1 Tax=Aphidius gifuensis TaxID=684658 RepID=UPI001CDCFD57|nr:protein FAR1-RELATED SEQUENCE 5-like [Aphidius gifuensis]